MSVLTLNWWTRRLGRPSAPSEPPLAARTAARDPAEANAPQLLSLLASATDLAEAFGVASVPFELHPRDHVARGDIVAIVRAVGVQRVLGTARWDGGEPGALPAGTRLGELQRRAGAHTALERCLIPVDAYVLAGDIRTPGARFRVRMADAGIFALAGACFAGSGAPGSLVASLVMVEAHPKLQRVARYMPAPLTGRALERWLDPGVPAAEALDSGADRAQAPIYVYPSPAR